MKVVLVVDKVEDLNWVKTVCITPPVPLVGTPVVGIILSTLNSDAIVMKVQLAKSRMLNLIHN